MCEYLAASRLERLGAHRSVVTKLFWKRTPLPTISLITVGITGVTPSIEWVVSTVSKRWSSVRMRTMFGRSGAAFGPTRSTQVSSSVTRASGSAAVSTGLPGPPTAASSCLPTSGRITPLASCTTFTTHLRGILSIERRALSSASDADSPCTR